MSFRKAVAEIRTSFGEVGQPVKQPLSQQDCLLILQRAQTARDALYHKALQKFGATSFRGSARGSCGGFRDGTGQAPARGNALILARLRLYYVAYACVLRSECGSAQRGKFLVVGRRSPLLRAKNAGQYGLAKFCCLRIGACFSHATDTACLARVSISQDVYIIRNRLGGLYHCLQSIEVYLILKTGVPIFDSMAHERQMV